MKIPLLQTRANQLTALQVLTLVASAGLFYMNSMVVAFVLLLLGTLFGAAAALIRRNEILRDHPELQRRKRRR